jgi:hypothetical protein
MYSIVDLAGTEGQSNFNFSFQYLSEAHIHVYIDSVETEDFTFSAAFTITLDTALTAAATVRIRRITPIDEQMVDFSNGSVLGETDLDTSVLQVLYAQQELDDFNEGTMTLQQNDAGNWDAENTRIVNLTSPVDPTDAASKSYVDAQLAAFALGEGFSLQGISGVDPTTTVDKGTFLVGDGGAPSELVDFNIGNNGELLTVDTTQPTNLKWESLMAKLLALLTTKGDIGVSTGAVIQRKAVGSDNQVLVADSNEADGLAWKGVATILSSIGGAIVGVPSIVNLRGFWASATSFTFSSTAVVLQNTAGACVRVAGNTAGCDISQAGPVASGRDQVGAFSPSSYVHFYYIWNGTNLDIIASTAAPTHSTGPTLPNGYTHWCYITTLPLNASTQLNQHVVMGNTVYRDPWDVMYQLCSKTNASEELFTSSTVLPTIAMSAQFEIHLSVSDNSAAAGDNITFYLRQTSGGGSGWSMITPVTCQPSVNGIAAHAQFSLNVPYLSGYYVLLSGSGTVTSFTLTIHVTSYTVPNNS